MKKFIILLPLLCLAADTPKEIEGWNISHGAWTQTTSKSKETLNSTPTAPFSRIVSTKNIEAEFEGNLQVQKPPSGNFYVGVFFRMKDDIRIQIMLRNGGQITVDQGSDTDRQCLWSVSYDPRRPVNMKISAKGEAITCVINKQKHTIKDDRTRDGTGFGFVAGNAMGRFEIKTLQ
ncbi:MAG: hypothetical protein AB1696_11510 [Planctomycetota bacterium]